MLLSIAACTLAIFISLGLTFARKPWAFVDRAGSRLSGTLIPLAVIFTRSGYNVWLTAASIVGTLVALAVHMNVRVPLLLILVQLLGQLSANAAKRYIARLRPEVWHFREELGFAYPSGHAVTAIVFYLGWAFVAWSWPFTRTERTVFFVAALVWALGIGWSRLSLGAHRATDVLGGYALGCTWLCLFLVAANL
ncbi:MAG TPA: phosphatase PAP2 family protein [Candidatus Acidoferrales bacterium]|nr:phosphatase PAP2 family protein [Candidatus Acidoferrales bacterium]